VADIGVDFGGPRVGDGGGGVAERARAVDDVVEQDAAAARHVADDVHDLALARPGPALVDDGEVGAQPVGQLARAHHPADIGGDDHQIVL
jgi:hypothetical protein